MWKDKEKERDEFLSFLNWKFERLHRYQENMKLRKRIAWVRSIARGKGKKNV